MWVVRLTPDEIASAAVVVAAVSAVYAGISARSAKRSEKAASRSAGAAERSAAAAESSLALDRDRALKDRRPQLTGIVKRLTGGSRELVITLESDEALTRVDLSITRDHGICFIKGAKGVRAPDPGEAAALRAFAYDASGEPAGLQPRQSATWPVMVADKAARTLLVEAECQGEHGRHWRSVAVKAPVQPHPLQTMW